MRHHRRLKAPRHPTGPTDARSVALDRLLRDVSSFPRLSLEPLDTADLPPRDAAFARALHAAVRTRWLTLRHVIQHCLRRRFDSLDPPVRAALLAGAAQILLLDVPDHAAIDQSVRWAKTAARRRAADLVNAALRALARLVAERLPAPAGERTDIPLPGGHTIRLAEPLFPEDPLRRLALTTSHHPALVRRWAEHLGPDRARLVALHGIVEPPLILNISRADPALPLDPFDPLPHDLPGFAVARAPMAQIRPLLANRTDVWVQDPASAQPVSLVRRAPRRILDACAGRGTKTRQLAARFPDAQIFAADADPDRAADLAAACAHLPNVAVLPFAGLPDALHASIDLLVLDVPCSNTGVLARRPEARYRFSPGLLAQLVELQRNILASLLPTLAPGGQVLYSTCSLEPEENQRQADWAAGQADLAVGGTLQTFPEGIPGQPATVYHDAAYAVLLVPRDGPPVRG